MFRSSSYLPLSQKDTPGLFADNSHRGLSFDYIPNVSEDDFTDTSQGWLSWICNIIVIFLIYIFTFITFPISGCSENGTQLRKDSSVPSGSDQST